MYRPAHEKKKVLRKSITTRPTQQSTRSLKEKKKLNSIDKINKMVWNYKGRDYTTANEHNNEVGYAEEIEKWEYKKEVLQLFVHMRRKGISGNH